jgi:hypothetical protein
VKRIGSFPSKNTEPGPCPNKKIEWFSLKWVYRIKCPYLTSIPSLSPIKALELLPKAKFCKIKKQL